MENRRRPRIRTRAFVNTHNTSDTDISSADENRTPPIVSSPEPTPTRSLNFDSVALGVDSSSEHSISSGQVSDIDNDLLDLTSDAINIMDSSSDKSSAKSFSFDFGSSAPDIDSPGEGSIPAGQVSDVDSESLDLTIDFSNHNGDDFKPNVSKTNVGPSPLVIPAQEAFDDTDNIEFIVTSKNLNDYSDLSNLFSPTNPRPMVFMGEPGKHHNKNKALVLSGERLSAVLALSQIANPELPRYAGLKVIRHVVRADGELFLGQEGPPGSINNIASHWDVAGNGANCIAAGNTYCNAQEEITIITNKSGDFEPPFETIKFALQAYKNLGHKFAETVQIEKVSNTGGIERIYVFSRDFLFTCLLFSVPGVGSSSEHSITSSQVSDTDSDLLDLTLDVMQAIDSLSDESPAKSLSFDFGSSAPSIDSPGEDSIPSGQVSDVDSESLDSTIDLFKSIPSIGLSNHNNYDFRQNVSQANVGLLPLVIPAQEAFDDKDNIEFIVTNKNLNDYSDLSNLFSPTNPRPMVFMGEPGKHHNKNKALVLSGERLLAVLALSQIANPELPRYAGLKVIRHVVRADGELFLGQEGAPGSINNIASHWDVAGNGNSCIAAGNTYCNTQEEISIITNKSGDFEPPFETIKFALQAYKSLGHKFAETVSIEKVSATGGVERIYVFNRDFLFACLLSAGARPLNDITNTGSSSSSIISAIKRSNTTAMAEMKIADAPKKLPPKTPFRSTAKRSGFHQASVNSLSSSAGTPGLYSFINKITDSTDVSDSSGTSSASDYDSDKENNKRQKSNAGSFALSPVSDVRNIMFNANSPANTTINSSISSGISSGSAVVVVNPALTPTLNRVQPKKGLRF